MKQLMVQDGDLVIGQRGFVMVGGASKVRQDLGAAFREPLRTDRFHPGWGSLLPSYIGQPVTQSTKNLIQSEVYRVVKNYMVTRMAVIQEDYTRGRRPQFESSEIVSNIDGVRIRQDRDRFFVRVSLSTLARERITIVTTVEAQ